MSSPSLSRASSTLNRPNFTPMGPRSRNRSNVPDRRATYMPSCLSDSDASSSEIRSRPSSPSVPVSGPSTKAYLPPIEEASHRQPAPPYEEIASESPSITPLLSPSRTTHFPQSQPLTAAPSVSFESVPVRWKGLPYEAAVWTLESRELQVLVSRAIRSSSNESFIRLLNLETIDYTLPDELKRLEALKSSAQSRYRFLIHRRTMLLQALNSSATTHPTGLVLDNITKLTSQISEVTVECDQLTQTMVHINDQVMQIHKLLDTHWASALAIALRKLNTSYGRRNGELQTAREKIEQLTADLDDAWAQAEKMACEIDEMDNQVLSDDEDDPDMETAQIITIPPDASPPLLSSTPLSPQLVTIEPRSPTIPMATLPLTLKRETIPKDVPDTVSLHSQQSTRSTKSSRHQSLRGSDGRRMSLLQAARKRSIRASESSLRLPSKRKSSFANMRASQVEPPLPEIPAHFIIDNNSQVGKKPLSTVLRPNSGSGSMERMSREDRGRRMSLTILPSLSSCAVPSKLSSMDDIHVRLTYMAMSEERQPTTSRTQTSSDTGLPDITENTQSNKIINASDRDQHHSMLSPLSHITEATPGFEESLPLHMAELHSSGDNTSSILEIKSVPPEIEIESDLRPGPSKEIPSIWQHVDTPIGSNPSKERLCTLVRADGVNGGKFKTYDKLRTITKRYSITFPLFQNKSVTQVKTNPYRRSG